MNSRRPKLGRNMLRAGSGGLAVVLALIALMFFQGGQLGDGDSDGEGNSNADPLASADPAATPINTTEVRSTLEQSSDAEDPSDSVEQGGLTADEQTALADGVLEVLIDENDYFVILPGTVTIYRPTEIPKLLQLAQQTTGDSNGIRVRILRRETSRAKAEIDLKTALAGIGIGADAVYMPQEFLPK